MSKPRSDYNKSDVRIKLINELRARAMTLNDIRSFLSQEYKRLGKIPKKCQDFVNYQVCERTVNREIKSIKAIYNSQLDYNIEFKTYKLDLYDFPDTLEDTEIQALDVALQKMRNDSNARKLLENLKSKLTTRLYHKIKNTEPTKAERKINEIDQKINSNYAVIGPRLNVMFDETVKKTLDYVICNMRQIRFLYYKNTEHIVYPLGILYGPNNVYLIARKCNNTQLSEDVRHYILSGISGIQETGKSFKKDDNFSIQEYANSMFGIYNDGKVYNVEWLIRNPKTISVAKNYIFHNTQKFINNKDGSLTIKMHTGGLQAISTFLATWGGDIIPIAPKELLDTYKKLLTNCLDSINK